MTKKKITALVLLICAVTGCGAQAAASDGASPERVGALYRDIYEKALCNNTLGTPAVTRDIVDRLGDRGYTAIDMENENQINMANPEPLVEFCEDVEEGRDGEAVFFFVTRDGGLIRFGFQSDGGEVQVTRSVWSFQGNVLESVYENSYRAAGWTCSDGYLFFEESFPPGYDGPPGYTAVRVEPLPEKCRDLNRLYILPVGYRSNNMFLIDWTQEDFGELSFDDLFDLLYPYVYGRQTPYEKSVEGEVYRVPEEEFEHVIMRYFQVDAATLRSGEKYLGREKCYEYRTRGFQDCACSPNSPYPEVVSCEEREDGTVKLTVNAVWPEKHVAKAFSHEVVVRPSGGGGFQYVSNRVIPSAENLEPSWYVDKLTDEEWKALYGEMK